jgi:hypothetical protein
MFRPLYRPSSGCTRSCYKANYTIYNVFALEQESAQPEDGRYRGRNMSLLRQAMSKHLLAI